MPATVGKALTRERARARQAENGLLHEFGVLTAARMLEDDAALTGFWEVYAAFYYCPSPLHGFMWHVVQHRDEIDGLPIIAWAVCSARLELYSCRLLSASL